MMAINRWQTLKRLLILRMKQIQAFVIKGLQSSKKSFVCLLLLGLVFSRILTACAESGTASGAELKLNLVSFSVTKAAHDQIIPKFVEKWEKEHKQKVTFERSYGGSVAQTDEIIAGKQEADIVHLSLPLDVIRIEEAGLIKRGWENKVPRRGTVTQSVAALVTRPNNPKKIETWSDLTRDDVKVVLANPKTSGIAIWQFLAFWGSVTLTGGEEETALSYVTKIYQNAPTLAKNAREASDLFFQKRQGDVLVTYENEILFAADNRPKLPYTVPEVNISIDNPVAVVDKNVDKHGTRRVAEAFVDYLYSEEAQREFAKLGYRSVNPFVAHDVSLQFPEIKTLFTAQDLGGWKLIKEKLFGNGAIFAQIKAKEKT